MPWPLFGQGWWGLVCVVLVVIVVHPAAPQTHCTLPAYLSEPIIHGWSSHVKRWGNIAVREYTFNQYSMNVSIDDPAPHQHFYQCHHALGDDTFILREFKHDVPMYNCVRFDKWSNNIVQLSESTAEVNSSRSLCREERLVPGAWPLVWRHLNLGYIPCPSIGGWDMQVINPWGSSYCEYVNPVPKPRFESECVLGDGMRLNFGLPLCKGDVSLPTNTTLFCLGHREIRGYTHVVVIDDKPWPKILMLRYLQKNDTMTMHLLEDIVIETADTLPDSRRKSHILLKKTLYNNLCTDNYHNCLAPETCDASNIINCQTTCKNYTTCLADKEPCDFDASTQGEWLEQSSMGSRILSINAKTASLDNQGSFQCLNVYSSSTRGRKPIVKVLNNGCKPRFACLDAEADGSSILKYRLSMSKQWPFRDNIVRGDLCRDNNFKDGPPQTGSRFQNQFDKILVRAPVPGSSARRPTVSCNLLSTISFRLSNSCSGTLRACQSGHAIVMTWGSGCGYAMSRIFYRCLYQSRTHLEKYIVTEVSDDPTQLHCWIRHEDPLGVLSNYLMQSQAADCANGPVETIARMEYRSEDQDQSADSCLDMPTLPMPPLSTAAGEKSKETMSSPTDSTETVSSTSLPSKTEMETLVNLDMMTSFIGPETATSAGSFPTTSTKLYQETETVSLPMEESTSPMNTSVVQHSSVKPSKGKPTKRPGKGKGPINTLDNMPGTVYSNSGPAVSMQKIFLLCFVTVIMNIVN